MINIFTVILIVNLIFSFVFLVRNMLKSCRFYFSLSDDINLKIRNGYKIYMNGYALKRGEDLKYYHLEEENFIVDDNKKILYISY